MRHTRRQVLKKVTAIAAREGFISEKRTAQLTAMLGGAISAAATTNPQIADSVRQHLTHRYHARTKRFTLSQVRPEMRAELDRRIMASVSLIKNNRDMRIAETLKRFNGWATSIPEGGTNQPLSKVRASIAKPTQRSRFEKRRVEIDQGHKMLANINHVVAMQDDAIAAKWSDRGKHDKSYDARPEHLARDGKWFVMGDGWAAKEGMFKAGMPRVEDVEMPGELVYCECAYDYAYTLNAVPETILSAKGKARVQRRA